jgi:transcriptional regulator with XRE-family HTH domain
VRRGALVDFEDARTIGRRLRRLRKFREKPLKVIAGLAGMSKSQLDRIERGEVALDKLSEIVALATRCKLPEPASSPRWPPTYPR